MTKLDPYVNESCRPVTELNDPSALICSLAAIRDARLTSLAVSIEELRALGLVTQAGDPVNLTLDGEQLLQLAEWGAAAA